MIRRNIVSRTASTSVMALAALSGGVGVAQAANSAPASTRPAATAEPAAAASADRVKLMTWHEDTGWRAHHSHIFGEDGTCDTAGYSFRPREWWRHHMSSITGSGQCNRVRLTNIAGTEARDFNLPVTFGGTIFNDNVGRVRVYHG